MGEYEDVVRSLIEEKYGSIPKMASEIGLPKTTIYHALERGLDNTTTKTRHAILDPLFGDRDIRYYATPVDFGRSMLPEFPLSPEEFELVHIFKNLDERGRSMLLSAARALREG